MKASFNTSGYQDEENLKLGEIAQLLRTLSGRYDQAARTASSY
jgi:predicted MarR family transcription regulator